MESDQQMEWLLGYSMDSWLDYESDLLSARSTGSFPGLDSRRLTRSYNEGSPLSSGTVGRPPGLA